jgi:hypothetical protein
MTDLHLSSLKTWNSLKEDIAEIKATAVLENLETHVG